MMLDVGDMMWGKYSNGSQINQRPFARYALWLKGVSLTRNRLLLLLNQGVPILEATAPLPS